MHSLRSAGIHTSVNFNNIIITLSCTTTHLFEISVGQSKGDQNPWNVHTCNGGDWMLLIQVNHGSNVDKDTTRALKCQIVLAHRDEAIGEFKAAKHDISQTILEMLPLGTAVVVHSRTHIMGSHIVHSMVHSNVMRVVETRWDAEEKSQNVVKGGIQKSEPQIENGAMRNVVQC